MLGLQPHLGIICVHGFRDGEFQNFRNVRAKPPGNTRSYFEKYGINYIIINPLHLTQAKQSYTRGFRANIHYVRKLAIFDQ